MSKTTESIQPNSPLPRMEEVERLMLMVNKTSDLTEFAYEENGFKFRASRDCPAQPLGVTPPAAPPRDPIKSDGQPAGSMTQAARHPVYINSEMVGIFYFSRPHDHPPLVAINSKVIEDTIVGVIESLRISHDVKAGVCGTILERLVENGHAVEYGQPLFKLAV